MGRMTSHAERLAAARQAVAALRQARQALPVDLADQMGAAARDTRALFGQLATVLQTTRPAGDWTPSATPAGDPLIDEVVARTLVALSGAKVCVHLRRAPAQPGVAGLALHRIDCHRCIRTVRKPPEGEADRCDWCGTRGVTTFWPLHYTLGTILVGGDACEGCAMALQHPIARKAGR